jgi:hypothetical protein
MTDIIDMTIDEYNSFVEKKIQKKIEIKATLIAIINYTIWNTFQLATPDFRYVHTNEEKGCGFHLMLRFKDLEFVEEVLNESIFKDCYEIEDRGRSLGDYYITYTKEAHAIRTEYSNGKSSPIW